MNLFQKLKSFLPAKKQKLQPNPKIPPAHQGKKGASELKKRAYQQASKFAQGLLNVRDIVAPSGIETDFNHIQIGGRYYRIFFVAGYPREVGANWLAPLINFTHPLDISMYYYPMEARDVLQNLRRKITEMETELNIEYKEGRILDPEVQLALQDAKSLQDELVAERERFFQFALYLALPAEDLKTLNFRSKQLESTLGSLMLLPRKATLQMEEGFQSCLPYFSDQLLVTRNMDTTSIATTFPLTSSSLTSDKGIMYGINEHNGSLIIFDRFSLENANSVVFAKAGAGKSYLIKLEAVRSLMLGTEIIIIDPENEYRILCEGIGGEFVQFDFNSSSKINPFDLSQVYEEDTDDLGLKILTLHSLLKVMLGNMNSNEEAILDRALLESYRLKGITRDPETQKLEPPLLEDLYKVLLGMEEAASKNLADRLERFVKGSAKGLFDQKTNVDLKNTFTVFGIRDLEESVRPVGMFLILDYIWTRIRRDRRKRILIVDEAWFMMKNPDSANFMHSIAKRCRKYYLGLTTITQDVEDFLGTDKGTAIIHNSSIQILMKQSPSAVDKLTEIFYLSEGERSLLLSANVGEGLFFAGENHVAMQVIASMNEHLLITTNPAEIEALEKVKKAQAATQAAVQETPPEAENDLFTGFPAEPKVHTTPPPTKPPTEPVKKEAPPAPQATQETANKPFNPSSGEIKVSPSPKPPADPPPETEKPPQNPPPQPQAQDRSLPSADSSGQTS